MTGMLTSPLPVFTAPSLVLPLAQYNQTGGLCSLTFGGNTLNFRTNPNEITWDYELITKVEQTYGGRVIQILGVKMDNLVVKVDCGQGGWPYAMQVVQFMRDLMVTQRNGRPATFTYTTRNWRLKVFAKSIPFFDSVTETIRELELTFNVQEDIAGTNISKSISDALLHLQAGIGFMVSGFNNFAAGTGRAPDNNNNPNAPGLGAFGTTPTTTPPQVLTAASSINNGGLGIPGLGILGI